MSIFNLDCTVTSCAWLYMSVCTVQGKNVLPWRGGIPLYLLDNPLVRVCLAKKIRGINKTETVQYGNCEGV